GRKVRVAYASSGEQGDSGGHTTKSLIYLHIHVKSTYSIPCRAPRSVAVGTYSVDQGEWQQYRSICRDRRCVRGQWYLGQTHVKMSTCRKWIRLRPEP